MNNMKRRSFFTGIFASLPLVQAITGKQEPASPAKTKGGVYLIPSSIVFGAVEEKPLRGVPLFSRVKLRVRVGEIATAIVYNPFTRRAKKYVIYADGDRWKLGFETRA